MKTKNPAAAAVRDAKQKALAALEDRKGRITPNRLVEAARATEHPWHTSFEWDDAKAAHEHRVETAREIIRTYVTARITDDVIVRPSAPVYVRDPRLPNDEQGYVNIARVRSDEELTREVLVQEFSRAAAALQRAYDVADALNARAQVKTLIAKINALRERAEQARL